MNSTTVTFYHTGPGGSFSGLTNDIKIAVASSVTAFIIGSVLFFIIGFLCGHFCRKENKVPAETVNQYEKAQGTPYYNDVVLKQELELRENIAYVPVQ